MAIRVTGAFTGLVPLPALFAYRQNHRLNAVNLSKKNNGINVPELAAALKYNISQKRRSKITMNILSLHKV